MLNCLVIDTNLVLFRLAHPQFEYSCRELVLFRLVYFQTEIFSCLGLVQFQSVIVNYQIYFLTGSIFTAPMCIDIFNKHISNYAKKNRKRAPKALKLSDT